MKSVRFGSWSTVAAIVIAGGLGAQAQAAPFLDFEGYDTSSDLEGQDGWVLNLADEGDPNVVATTDSGAYVGGIAVGHVGLSGGNRYGRLGLPGIENARGLRADFFSGDTGYDNDGIADSITWLKIWEDNNNDGLYTTNERGIGFGLDNGTNNVGDFQILVNGGEGGGSGDSGMTYGVDVWYRLTLIWSDVFDNGGTPSRTLDLYAEDLTNQTLVNGGNPVATAVAPETEFDFTAWSGIGFRGTRGLIDNIEILPIPEPTTAALAGAGLLALGMGRRRA